MKHKSKIIKWTKRILIGIIGFFFLLIVGLYLWVNLRLNSVISDNDYAKIVKVIQSSKELPARFKYLYFDMNNAGSLNEKLLNDIGSELLDSHKRSEASCLSISYMMFCGGIDSYTLALAFDRDVGCEKCLDYYLSKFDFLYSVIGVENASRFYFKKELDQLSDDEMRALIIMVENPSYYNILKHPERIQNKLMIYKE